VLNYYTVQGMYFVGRGCYICDICVYCRGLGTANSRYIFRTINFVLRQMIGPLKPNAD
jgi:hypothetical protein